VAAVDPGTAPERRLAGGPPLLEGGQQAVVVAAQPVAIGGESFGEQAGGPGVRPADQPRRPLAHPLRRRDPAGRRHVLTHDVNLTVVGAANQLIHWNYQRWTHQRWIGQLYGGAAMTAGSASLTLATWRGRRILGLLCAVAFLDFTDASITNVALPHIRAALGFSAQDLQWVPSAYLLTYGGFMLLGGRLADLVGRR